MIIGDSAIQISVPRVTLGLLLLWVLLFVLTRLVPALSIDHLAYLFGYVPDYVLGHVARSPWRFAAPVWLTPLTAALLQPDWFHLLGDLVFAWVAGRHVEDALGRRVYFLYLILLALITCGADLALHGRSLAPRIGASGLVAGMIGGYIALFPWASYKSLIYLWFVGWVKYRIPATVALGGWVLVQMALAVGQADNVLAAAFTVQIAGVLAGGVLALLCRRMGIAVEVIANAPLAPVARRNGA